MAQSDLSALRRSNENEKSATENQQSIDLEKFGLAGTVVDLKQATEHYPWVIVVHPPDKQPEPPADAWVRRGKDIIVSVSIITGVIAICVLCGWVIFLRYQDAPPSAEDQKWAMSTLSAVVGAGFGYLVKGKHP
jgi:hypothetical protein